MKKIVLGIIVSLLIFRAPMYSQEIDVRLLQGKWQSVSDPKSMIEFKNDKKIDYYSGQIEENVSSHSHCDGKIYSNICFYFWRARKL